MSEVRRCHDGYSVEVVVELPPVTPTGRSYELVALEKVAREAEAFTSLISGLVIDTLDLERPDWSAEQAGSLWQIRLRLALPGSGVAATIGAAKDFKQLWDDAHDAASTAWRRDALKRQHSQLRSNLGDAPW